MTGDYFKTLNYRGLSTGGHFEELIVGSEWKSVRRNHQGLCKGA